MDSVVTAFLTDASVRNASAEELLAQSGAKAGEPWLNAAE